MFVLPFNRENSIGRTPWVVFSLMVVNTAILLFTYGFYQSETVFKVYGFTPAHPQFSGMLSSMFLHAGFWHLLGNMWFLWMFGNRVEDLFGKWLFLGAYILSGIGGNIVHYISNPTAAVPCVGASGAISGVAGMFFILFPRTQFDLDFYFGWWKVKTIPAHTHAAVGTWIGEQTLLGLLTQAVHFSSVAFWAHVGGFGTGAVIALVYCWAVPAEDRKRQFIPASRLSHFEEANSSEGLVQLDLNSDVGEPQHRRSAKAGK